MALAAALVCLLVVMLFAAAVVQALVTRQRATRTEEQQLQCLLFTESAMDRAYARLRLAPDYSGETWTVSLDDRGVARPGVAHIRIEPVAEESAKRQIAVEVYWPDDPIFRIRRVKQITVTLPVSGTPS